MNTPSPLFFTAFAQPLTKRLTDEAALAKAQIVIGVPGPSTDIRLVEQSSMETINIITNGGSAARFLVQWPDGTLAYAYLPVGGQVLDGVRVALLRAYAHGRDRLEQIHLEMGAPQGQA